MRTSAPAPLATFAFEDAPLAWIALALLVGIAVGLGGLKALALVVALVLVAMVALRPEAGAYLYLIVTPLIVGLARGDLIPLLRPNEAFVLLILAALVVRVVCDLLAGQGDRPAFTAIDAALLLMAVCSSVLPLLLLYGRGEPVGTDDFLFAMVLWKYWIVYRLFAFAVTTPAQVRMCLRLAMLAAVLVALIAFLQVLQLFGVAEFLWQYYDRPFSGSDEVITERGTSTIAYSFGVADMMVMNLAIAIAWGLRAGLRDRLLLGLGGVVFVLGVVATGQVSGLLGLLVALVTIGCLTGRLGLLAGLGLPLGLVATVLFWPVVDARLAGFAGPDGLPPSWVGRLDNLQSHILPQLGEGLRWLTGVRPSARIEAPEAWRAFIWIESGYLWLVWIGGLPLLLAFLGFLAVTLRRLLQVIRRRDDAIGIAAMAAFTSLVVIAVLMILDPHLTTRGSADLFFPLLALALVGTSGGAHARHQNPPS